MDNFKTHAASPFHETFEPKEAKKLEIDWNLYISQYESWLDMAEIELHILNGQCLNSHISTKEEINQGVEAWTIQRNN